MALSIAIIIVLFVVLFTPNFVFSVLVFTVRDPCQEMIYYRDWYWGVLIAFVSSAINPWIYAIRIRGFSNAMKRIAGQVLPCICPLTLSSPREGGIHSPKKRFFHHNFKTNWISKLKLHGFS